MSFNDEYLKLRKKRLEEQAELQKQHKSNSFEFVSGPYQSATLTEDDIAPIIVETVKKTKDEESGLFKGGAFSDGYQFGDITKTILGTAGDVASGLLQGVTSVGEGLGDLISYGVAGVMDLVGNDDDAERLRKEAAKSQLGPLFDSFREGTNIDDNSLLGDFGYDVTQGLGQVGAIIATGGVGKAAGLGSVGTSALTTGTMFASSTGSGMSEAYQGGATDEEALAYGVMSGAIDAGTEMIFGGLGKPVKAIGVSKGLTSLDDVFAKKLSSKISNQFFQNAAEYGIKAGAEGVEEFLAGLGSAAAKKLTYMSEEELSQLVEDENLLEQFAAGVLVSGIAQSGDLVKSTKTGRDFITNFSANEETVIEKVYNDRVAEAEQDGTKLTNKEKNKIYEQVQNDMRKGYISTDDIESVLGGETYKTYKEAADRDTALKKEYEALNKEYTELYKMKSGEKSDEQIDRQADLKKQLAEIKQKIDNSDLSQIKDNLSKEVYDSLTRQVGKNGKKTRTDDFLIESYNEKARRGMAFEADLSQYDDKTAEVVKRAIDSKILNNTRRTHEFVDMLAKISADKGVLFDFTNNAKLKESSFAVDGASINGYVTKDGITVNINSKKSLNSVVGHEISHVLEGTELYAEMQSALFEYAKSKKDYDGRRKALEELYKNVEGAEINAELTADLVGDYLFTDEAFINNLSTKHRNVFKKIYDEIKYLLKVATAGSKEVRELEKVKRTFEKAYRESGKTSEGASTVAIAFESNQIKSVANEKPTSNPDIRFSLSESVEETKDLIAVHNLSEEKLVKSLNLGGLPMPSIAIARAKDGHSNFGNISLVFNKETIDPQFMRSNKVYSGDAWTPTYPRVEYKLNDKALKQIRDKISSLVSYDVLTDVGNAHLDYDNMTDTLNRFGGNVAEAFKYDDGLKYAYLKDTGANITLPMKEKNLSYYGYRENGAIIRVAEALSEEELQEALNGDREAQEKIEPIVRRAVAEYTQEKYGNEPELLDLMMPKEKLTFSDLDGYIQEARNYHRNGVQQTVDTKAARELIREQVNQAEYENWLKNLFSNIVEKEGIRNDKDIFTPSGNRRSFEALHYEHNLENVIKAMKEKGDKGIGAWGGGNIFGAATTEYGSISEIKSEAQSRMKLMSESEYEEIRKGFSDRFFELAHSLPIHKDSFVATDDAANMLIEAVAKFKTKSGMANYLRNESKGWANYSDYVVDDLIQLTSDIRSMPVGYFEAKPQRAVGFNEVAAAIIPDSTNAELKQILTDKGIPFIEYESGNEQARLEALNSLEEAKFSLSKEGETPKRYGNYNIFGEDIRLEAPTQEEVAPIQEEVAPESEVVAKNAIPTEDIAPMPSEPTLYELEQKQAELEDIIRKAMENNDPNAPKLIDEYGELLDTIAKRKKEESAIERERLASLDDADVPPEMEAPYYGEGREYSGLADPFKDRDIKAVGNRKVKAYMYENPEVKPFFQEEANIMLGDLRDSIKGERIYTPVEGGVPGAYGSDSYGIWTGTKRRVSPDIAYLLDELHYSYEDIEKGLKAIIEDNGAENNAASKRIEFILNDRLIKGYSDFLDGFETPPNQDYINLIKEKQISEYSEEARAKFFEEADKYAPPVEDISPIAPIAEAYEAIKPKKEKTTEPRLKRVKEGEPSPRGKERKWIGTSTESEAVDGKILPDDLDQEAIHYQPISNKKTLDTANSKLDGMGYEASVTYFNSQFANKKTTLEDIVLGERLIQEAIKRGDTKTAGELIEDVAILGTELGQKVQALSIIKRLTPEGQLRMLQRTVERGKTRGDKAYEGVEITQEMIDKILATYGKDGSFDQTKLNEAVEDAKQKIADQMNVSKMDKVNAWRYLSMLGNPKTHIRNLVSNVAMRGTTAVKNVVARTVESIAPIENRTKTWKKASDEVKAFSQKTAAEMQDVLRDGGKYNEDASIKQKRATFKNKVLNGVYEFNSDMLSKEDWWFSKPAFTNALSEYLTANGINTVQDIQNNPKIVAKAKQYATEQSQIATFRQYSWLANKINEIEHKNVATQIAVGAVLPFKKTPINIAKTALNYSPLGFVKTLTYDASQVKNGKMEASELIDHLAQNVTGSALVLVGYMLANAGFLNGAGEDDKEGDYDYQLGEQAYSINIGDATFSLSWLSPIAMPLFVGANSYEQLVEGKEWNGDVVVETLAQTLDPLSEMSFLSSLDSVLSSYDSGIEKFAGIAQSAGQSYATQFVPTLSSQVAAVMDDTKRSTKVAADSEFKFVDETINKLKYKIPFLRETLEPSTDIWGNEIKQSENFIERALENFIAPYSKRDDISSGVDEEIKDLYRETGDAGLIPSIPYNYINYDGEKYEMSASEYTEYKKLYGQNAYELMSDLFKTSTYKAASSEERADMVNRVYDFARDEAKREYFAKYGVEFTNATKDGEEYYKENSIKGAIEYDMTPDEYEFVTENPEKYKFFNDVGVTYEEYANGSEDFKDAFSWAFKNPEKFTVSKAVTSDVVMYQKYTSDLNNITSDKDKYGKSISGSRKEKVIEYVNNLDIDYGAKLILFKSEYNADNTYNYDIIDYLNNRQDISYEEMETILKELGFTVLSDGTIQWD